MPSENGGSGSDHLLSWMMGIGVLIADDPITR